MGGRTRRPAATVSSGWEVVVLLISVLFDYASDGMGGTEKRLRDFTETVAIPRASIWRMSISRRSTVLFALLATTLFLLQGVSRASQGDGALKLALLIDSGRGMQRVLSSEKKASAAFLKESLRSDGDRAEVLSFGEAAHVLSDLHVPRKALAAAIRKIQPDPVGPIAPKVLYDAITSAADDLRTAEGRKMIVVITDGIDGKSRHSLDEAINAARFANVGVYTVLVPIPGSERNRWNAEPLFPGKLRKEIAQAAAGRLNQGQATLRTIAAQTGGETYEVDRKNSLRAIYREIAAKLGSQ